jgi:anaerobic ribonucleoside-triphosphate reductase activating protein
MLLHGFVPVSRANGPGRRAVLWFQGCNLNCPGCFNQPSHPFEGVPIDDGSDIIQRVLALHHAGAIEGLTFSGGEPMQQVSSVLELIERLRDADATPSLTFGMFTGYTVGELDQGRYFTFNECPEKTKVWQQIRDRLDFAVMGRYNRLAPGTQPLRSSRNQRLHLFTARYEESDFGEQIVEVSIEENGAAIITGFPVLGCPA